MDALALLCNLHAEGPRSRLRFERAGCTSLADVAFLTADELAAVLGIPRGRAERIAREAHWMSNRDAATLLDQEEESRASRAVPGPRVPETGLREVVLAPTPPGGGATPLRPGRVPALHAAWCAALAGEEIHTFEELVAADAAELAERLERTPATVVGLQTAAQRHLAAPAQAATEHGVTERPSVIGI